MERLKRYLSGGHSPSEIRWHLAILVGGYWGLVLCAWLGYPSENNFSVTSRMLSALGSFEDHYNPQWFWLFSLAMVYCGLCMAPIMLYVRRRLLAVSSLGSSVGTLFFLTGCMAILLTGLFPYAHRDFLGWQLSSIHMKTAGLIGVSFGLGFVWHGLILLRDRFAKKTFARHGINSYRRFIGPFLVCIPIVIAIGYRLRWKSVLSAFHAAANASVKETVDNLAMAFSGMAHFPFLEHLAIWALTIFVVWFTIVLPHPEGEE